jgi:two-component system, cell cycle sensor histidine kinase and response regulator CckA
VVERLPILVVDDDSLMVRTIGDILRFKGYDAIPAGTGAEGLTAASVSDRTPAIALIDLKLPDMDGIELVSRLRDIAPLVEVVILTGHATIDSAIRALREQSYDYLLKPVQPDHLMESVARAGDRWQRRRAEQALELSELRLRRMFECVSDAVFITDDERRIIDANPAAAKLAKRASEDLRGESLDALLAPWLDRVDVRENNFAPGFHVHSVRDLSEQRRLESALSHTRKIEALGRLASGVAHDFNNLLTVVTSFTSLLADRHGGDDPDRELIDGIKEAAASGTALTRQLLALGRTSTVHPRPLNVNEVVTAAERIMRRLLGYDIELKLSLDAELYDVYIDPGQVEQILFNLAANARDAMPDGGRLSITTQNAAAPADVAASAPALVDRCVVMSVSDTGEGIPADALEKIFEPFFTTKSDDRGTGLGLSIVHDIVEQGGGAVRVTSLPKSGTTFSIYLPRFERP